jgi:hypothetical protein
LSNFISVGSFVESRDRCNKPALHPTFEVAVTEKKSLWPVVVLENQSLMYCALPLMPHTVVTQQDKTDISLAEL